MAIPLIALTAHAMEGDERKAREAGCDDYDTKPVDLVRLLAKIEGAAAFQGSMMDSRAMPTDPRPGGPKPAPAHLDLSKIRHDLRTPINHILGYCEMLIEVAQDQGHTRLIPDLEKIHAAGRTLLATINDLFDPDKTAGLEEKVLHHELRTPLNQAIGYGPDSPPAGAYAARRKRSAGIENGGSFSSAEVQARAKLMRVSCSASEIREAAAVV